LAIKVVKLLVKLLMKLYQTGPITPNFHENFEDKEKEGGGTKKCPRTPTILDSPRLTRKKLRPIFSTTLPIFTEKAQPACHRCMNNPNSKLDGRTDEMMNEQQKRKRCCENGDAPARDTRTETHARGSPLPAQLFLLLGS
jgi:hypothetical protein